MISETNTQVCEDEVFRARCPYTQHIVVTQARYGHIQASRCVAANFEVLGYFGCLSDVLDIVSERCDKKQRCEISIPDEEITDPESCLTGLPLYMDVSYVCIPGTSLNIINALFFIYTGNTSIDIVYKKSHFYKITDV